MKTPLKKLFANTVGRKPWILKQKHVEKLPASGVLYYHLAVSASFQLG